MPNFDFEDMRYIMSPLEVLCELSMETEGLIRANISDPKTPDYSVVGYDFVFFGGGERSMPVDTDRLKVVQLAIADTAFYLTVALILPENTATEMQEMKEEIQRVLKTHREERKAWELEMEQDLLESKKRAERIRIIQEVEFTPDAIDLIKREITTEHPELQFPDQEPKQD